MEQTDTRDAWLALVQRQVESLEYGVVQIVVHGARVVQIERTEKVRLADDRPTKVRDGCAEEPGA